MMGQQRSQLVLVLLSLFIQFSVIAAVTDNNDVVALRSLASSWQNTPSNWVGDDPCGDLWVGIECTNSRVTSLLLSNMNLTGQLSGDIGSLSELQYL
jgi:hypothetical protein